MAGLTNTATGERIAGPDPRPGDAAELMDINAVSALGVGSPRHIYRLCDAGRMPPPVKLGALVRWRRGELLGWIAGGCRPVRGPAGAGR
jgi:predicted DNA-binding transcriptional regulator AlpA